MTYVYRTKSGKILSDEDIEALADEAERGYDVTQVQVRKYEPPKGVVLSPALFLKLMSQIEIFETSGDPTQQAIRAMPARTRIVEGVSLTLDEYTSLTVYLAVFKNLANGPV